MYIRVYIFQKLEEELAECNCNLQQKKMELENCQCACIEAENEFYEASDKIEVGGKHKLYLRII